MAAGQFPASWLGLRVWGPSIMPLAVSDAAGTLRARGRLLSMPTGSTRPTGRAIRPEQTTGGPTRRRQMTGQSRSCHSRFSLTFARPAGPIAALLVGTSWRVSVPWSVPRRPVARASVPPQRAAGSSQLPSLASAAPSRAVGCALAPMIRPYLPPSPRGAAAPVCCHAARHAPARAGAAARDDAQSPARSGHRPQTQAPPEP